ncbi:MAG TPA: hypothetical protein ENH85_06955 [Candidatus Scalindua sp.]|nr:hypothetical protein [Candidatus Scalindua sp.]
MKTKHTKANFLHAHPYTASKLNINKDHVIVDREDWKWIQDNKEKVLAATELFDALNEISEGKGPYDLDPIQHASNCIEDMKAIALEAIKKATK